MTPLEKNILEDYFKPMSLDQLSIKYSKSNRELINIIHYLLIGSHKERRDELKI